MKCLTLFFILGATVVAHGTTTTVIPMSVIPKKVVSFANEPHTVVTADKRLIELFLTKGRPALQLSEQESALDEETSIEHPTTTSSDGSVSTKFVLGGCNGVFTDEAGIVYFWRLSSPRVLDLISQKHETTRLVMKEEHLELIRGLEMPIKR